MLKSATDTTKKIITEDNGEIVYRDAIIQRFEYTTELARKTIQLILFITQTKFDPYPKSVLKKAKELGIVQNIELRIDFINERNILSHTYSEEQSKQSYKFIKKHYHEFENIYNSLHTFYNEKIS